MDSGSFSWKMLNVFIVGIVLHKMPSIYQVQTTDQVAVVWRPFINVFCFMALLLRLD